MTSAFLPAPPLPSSTIRPNRTIPRAQVTTVSDRQLAQLASTGDPIVLKCFANYCPSCRGVAPKFNKIAAAYQGSRVKFCQMDYARYEQFCKDTMGVKSLPFFAIWRDGQFVGGEARGWQSMGKLVETIEHVLGAPDE